MNVDGFRSFLEKKKKSENTIESCLRNADRFESFLLERDTNPEDVSLEDLEQFIEIELEGKQVSRYMWTLLYYFSFMDNEEMHKHVARIREKHTKKKRRPFKLKKFMGIDQDSVKKLKSVGIEDVKQMLRYGKTKAMKADLSKKTELMLMKSLRL